MYFKPGKYSSINNDRIKSLAAATAALYVNLINKKSKVMPFNTIKKDVVGKRYFPSSTKE